MGSDPDDPAAASRSQSACELESGAVPVDRTAPQLDSSLGRWGQTSMPMTTLYDQIRAMLGNPVLTQQTLGITAEFRSCRTCATG